MIIGLLLVGWWAVSNWLIGCSEWVFKWLLRWLRCSGWLLCCLVVARVFWMVVMWLLICFEWLLRCFEWLVFH